MRWGISCEMEVDWIFRYILSWVMDREKFFGEAAPPLYGHNNVNIIYYV